ncbi:MAG: putative oxidoreductase [Candidatus Nanohaloarchaea archaeon]|jgi:putative oxidoreductase
MTAEIALLIGRILFGGYFAVSGLNHFMKTEQLAGWAEHKGAPYAGLLVYLSGLMLLAGGLGIAAGVYPVVSVALIGVFLAVVTPWFHDFWALEGEEKQNQMTHFLKNVALFGAALTLLAADWSVYAVGITLGVM